MAAGDPEEDEEPDHHEPRERVHLSRLEEVEVESDHRGAEHADDDGGGDRVPFDLVVEQTGLSYAIERSVVDGLSLLDDDAAVDAESLVGGLAGVERGLAGEDGREDEHEGSAERRSEDERSQRRDDFGGPQSGRHDNAPGNAGHIHDNRQTGEQLFVDCIVEKARVSRRRTVAR